jgi:hypothetical protein
MLPPERGCGCDEVDEVGARSCAHDDRQTARNKPRNWHARGKQVPEAANMASAQPMTDHDQIRQWAEERGAQPASVKGTGGKGDTGMIRLDFPGFSGAKSLQKISWNEWFRQFDANNLALIVQDKTSRGQQSNFNKLVSRKTAGAGSTRTRKTTAGKRASGGRKSTQSRGARAATSSSTASRRATSSRASASRKGSTGARTSSRTSSKKRTAKSAKSGGGRQSARAARR